MITIIAGSRDYNEYKRIEENLSDVQLYGWTISEIVSGGARGVDHIGEQIAHDYEIPLRVMKADWDSHGKAAGYIRNVDMANYAEALIAFWDGKSKGTKHMIDIAIKHGLYIKVFYI